MRRNKVVTFWKTSEIDGYLSNWHNSPMVIDDVTYFCCEQYMMAKKIKKALKRIMSSKRAEEIKRLGRSVSGFKDNVWKENSEEIVYTANLYKFKQNDALCARLLRTGNLTIIEASPWDKVWGVGLYESDPRILSPEKWPGLNLLGKILEKVRDTLRNEQNEENSKEERLYQ